VDEIRTHFASTLNGNAISILSIHADFPAWVVRFDDRYGVAIEIKTDVKISERFSNVRFFSDELSINGEKKNLLLLTSSLENLRNEFANVCALFVEPGIVGEERNNIISEPHNWWLKWKELLGNRNYEKAVYSVLGELVVYQYLKMLNIEPKWTGPKSGSVDFESKYSNYEVKSTINKYESVISISSQFQLKTNKDLYLIFCRFEEANYGISINSVVDKLISLGEDKGELNKYLYNLGIEEYSLDRTKTYKVLEIRKYRVDNEFPIITANSFKDSKIPDNILHFIYKVDLAGINYNLISEDFLIN
jgi:Putative  PD-(D/E)XK family member, (DUF4420)